MPSHEQLLRRAADLAEQLASVEVIKQEEFTRVSRTVKRLNEVAVEIMNETNSSATSFRMLRAAEGILGVLETKEALRYDLVGLKALTFNNLGCYFQGKGKHLAALEYLHKTLEVEQTAGVSNASIATTMLNLSAVLSKLSRHSDALEFALNAVSRLEQVHEQSFESDLKMSALLSSAYYNYAVELDYLGRSSEASAYYEQAYRNSLSSLGVAHAQTRKFKEKADTARTKLSTRGAKQASRGVPPELITSTSTNESKPLVVIGQFYMVLAGERCKVIVLDKLPHVKLIAFNERRDILYKLQLPSADLSQDTEELLDQLKAGLEVERGKLRWHEAGVVSVSNEWGKFSVKFQT
mmetsp:Transcript_34777/g.61208  ORF Transcript_34777/g.61208 Transcript_34777/m.61208 type:complete len:352 (+) Transcript_34777:810-1865(+)